MPADETMVIEEEVVDGALPPPTGLPGVGKAEAEAEAEAGAGAEVEVPPPPPGGYSKKALDEVVDALEMALNAVEKALKKPLSKLDRVPKEAVVKGKVDVPFPAAYAAEIVTLLATASSVGGSMAGRYDVDVESMLGGDEGLERLAMVLELLAGDKTFLARVKDIMSRVPAAVVSPSSKAPAPPPVEKKGEAPPSEGPMMPSDFM